jgi:hypothetical protein
MPGYSTVKPKRELIEIVVQMFTANSALMGAQEPPSEQSTRPVAGGQQIVTYIGFFTNYFMNVAKTVQAIVSLPSTCANLASRFNGLFNGILQALCGGTWNLSKVKPSDSRTIQLSCNHNHRLYCRPTTPFPRFFASDVRFIDFHNGRKPAPSWSGHCSADFMQPTTSTLYDNCQNRGQVQEWME